MARPGARFDAAHADLVSSFNKSVVAVREHADVFERDYGRPAVNYFNISLQAQPVVTTFLAIFALLSFFPVLTFVGWSLFIAGSFLFVALSLAFIGTVVVILFFGSILLIVLASAFFGALFLTAFTITSYLSLRLLLLVRSDGTRGVGEWVEETRDRFITGIKKPATTAPKRGQDDENVSSDGSAVVVKDEDNEHVNENSKVMGI